MRLLMWSAAGALACGRVARCRCVHKPACQSMLPASARLLALFIRYARRRASGHMIHAVSHMAVRTPPHALPVS